MRDRADPTHEARADSTPSPGRASEQDLADDASGIERLVSPWIRALPAPTSLSPLRYDLNAGVPDRASLPAPDLAEAFARVLRDSPAEALTYGGQQGFEPLRGWIARHSFESGIEGGSETTSAHVTLCSGSAHAIDNIAATFLAPGDVVVVPAPTYPGAIRTFRARGATVVDVPQDRNGLRIDALDEALQRQHAAGAPAKLIYVIANYDNPSGSTLAGDRRTDLLGLAAEHGAPVIEDDAYAGIDLNGPPPPSLFSLTGGRGVMRVGTFSKTIATGLRVGWILAEPPIVDQLVFGRFDNGASPLLHRAVLSYLESGAYEPHIERLRALYRERRDAAIDALRRECEDLVSFETPAGGFVLWVRLAEGIDAAAAVQSAARHHVAITPGTSYFATDASRPEGERYVRLVYSALPPDELREAIKAFGTALRALSR